MQTKAITAVVLTYNEEKNLPAALESLAGFCPVMILDSGSTDSTLTIASNHQTQVYHHDFSNHADQWAWALAHLPIKSDWLLAMDSDYVVSEALKDKIVNELDQVDASIDGIYVNYRYSFAGSIIRFGGTRKQRLQIVRLNKAKLEPSDLVDNRFIVEGKTIYWKSPIYESNYYDQDISLWMAKQDKYSMRLAVEEELRRQGLLKWHNQPSIFGSPDQRITWLRQKWLKMPLFVRPLFYFIYRYVIMFGFLDGKGGFLYHFLQGFVLRIMVDWKIGQLRQNKMTGEKLLAFKKTMLENGQGSFEKIMQSMP